MKCDYCEIAKKEIKDEVVYEDEQVIAVIKDLAANPGTVSVFPKEHLTIIELVPDSLVDHLFRIANKLSVALFESLGVQGTNIVVQNGTAAGQKVPHFSVDIIPRKENDGLDLQWQALQLMEDEADTAFIALKEDLKDLVLGAEEKKKVVSSGKTELVLEKEKSKDGEENYMVKQLRRKP